ncbi:MAG: hypothetical protein WC317_03145 [Candidatus Omnitrophota bacterium]|jgi:hypothetical protein
MNLFLIENDRTIDFFKGSAAYREGSDVTVCFNYLAYLRLKREGGKHIFYFIEDLFTQADYKSLHSATDHFALDWYRRDGTDHSVSRGISYGDMVRITFSRKYMLTVLLKYGEAVRKGIERWPEAEKVYFDLSVSNNSFYLRGDDKGRFFNKVRLVEQVCRQLKRECVPIAPVTPIPSLCVSFKQAGSRKTPIRSLKDAVKGMLMEAGALISALSGSRGNTYFFSYFNINSILGHMTDKFIVSGSGSNVLNPRRFLNPRFLQFDDVSYNLDKDERRFLESIENKYLVEGAGAYLDGFFVFNGLDYHFLYYPAVKDLVCSVIPGLMEYTGKVRKAVRQFGISKIIIFEEIDEQFQAVIAACRSAGIESVWVDHGIQGSNHAQRVCDRGRSDLVICSGEFFTGYYRSQGTGTSRYVALGNPSLDIYTPDKIKHVSSIKSVMFLSFEDGFYSHLDRFAYQEKYYEEIFSIFDELNSRNVKVYFKPHPGYEKKYFKYLFDFFKVDESKFVYIEDAPFSSVVYDMDLVVSNVTSCFYESQAAGVPTVFLEPYFNPETLLPPLNGTNGEEVIRVSTGKELMRIITENLGNAEKLNLFLKDFLEKHANKYMGTLDGMAGSRIVEYLCK